MESLGVLTAVCRPPWTNRPTSQVAPMDDKEPAVVCANTPLFFRLQRCLHMISQLSEKRPRKWRNLFQGTFKKKSPNIKMETLMLTQSKKEDFQANRYGAVCKCIICYLVLNVKCTSYQIVFYLDHEWHSCKDCHSNNIDLHFHYASVWIVFCDRYVTYQRCHLILIKDVKCLQWILSKFKKMGAGIMGKQMKFFFHSFMLTAIVSNLDKFQCMRNGLLSVFIWSKSVMSSRVENLYLWKRIHTGRERELHENMNWNIRFSLKTELCKRILRIYGLNLTSIKF